MLSVTTDYKTGTGCPEEYLRRIGAAGFTHIHWCHQWDTDFLYCEAEVEQIADWLDECGLRLLDLHGSAGREKAWGSVREYERRAGVELVANRIAMTARLGGDVVIMHLPGGSWEEYAPRARQSLDELRPVADASGVRIALENGGSHQSFDDIERALSAYDEEYLGLCYDAGHGNLFPEGLVRLDAIRDRLVSVHLHDNDGSGDQHRLLFTGTVDWVRLAGIIAGSSYVGPVSMEVSMRNEPPQDEASFLQETFWTGSRFAAMIASAAQT
ncbi:MAG: sugar phosphate isomerase/epimerase [Armatimonadetes bacterium]|nr:sugar phosphate isomerase/epimerase [Armatimonadota bacterium]